MIIDLCHDIDSIFIDIINIFYYDHLYLSTFFAIRRSTLLSIDDFSRFLSMLYIYHFLPNHLIYLYLLLYLANNYDLLILNNFMIAFQNFVQMYLFVFIIDLLVLM